MDKGKKIKISSVNISLIYVITFLGFIFFVAGSVFPVVKEFNLRVTDITDFIAYIVEGTGENSIRNTAQVSYEDIVKNPYNVSSNETSVEVLQIPSDITPPEMIQDFSVLETTENSITVIWQAPFDNSGKAASYDIHYNIEVIKGDEDWDKAFPVDQKLDPKNSGEPEQLTISSLKPDTSYWIGIKSQDVSGNISSISNIINTKTLTSSSTEKVTSVKIEYSLNIKNISLDSQEIKLKFYDFVSGALMKDISFSGQEDLIQSINPDIQKADYKIVIKVPFCLTKKNEINLSADNMEIKFANIIKGNLADTDDVVNSLDWSILSSKWGKTDPVADINQDSIVNSLDWGIMNTHWGQSGDD